MCRDIKSFLFSNHLWSGAWGRPRALIGQRKWKNSEALPVICDATMLIHITQSPASVSTATDVQLRPLPPRSPAVILKVPTPHSRSRWVSVNCGELLNPSCCSRFRDLLSGRRDYGSTYSHSCVTASEWFCCYSWAMAVCFSLLSHFFSLSVGEREGGRETNIKYLPVFGERRDTSKTFKSSTKSLCGWTHSLVSIMYSSLPFILARAPW